MTAGVLEEEQHACHEAGMNDYMSKPFRIETLIEAARRRRLRENREHWQNRRESFDTPHRI